MNDRDRWDRKYADREFAADLKPSAWLVENVPARPGRALDLATGLGDNAVWLATRGWQVTAIDISPVGLSHARRLAGIHGVEVHWIEADLTRDALPDQQFDLILVTQYLQREKLPLEIVESLAPGGWLIYETFTLDQMDQPANHLKNPDYLLRPNELLEMFKALRIRQYRDAIVNGSAVASLVAERFV